jgi:hypothetical protein
VNVSVAEGHEIDIDDQMQKVLGGGTGGMQITAPRYTTLTKGKLQVSYAVIGEDDYYYQIELLKPPSLGESQILAALIQAFSTVVPQHIHTYIRQPPKDLDWPVYTVIVKGGARLMGAKKFMEEKLVNKLLELNFWS